MHSTHSQGCDDVDARPLKNNINAFGVRTGTTVGSTSSSRFFQFFLIKTNSDTVAPKFLLRPKSVFKKKTILNIFIEGYSLSAYLLKKCLNGGHMYSGFLWLGFFSSCCCCRLCVLHLLYLDAALSSDLTRFYSNKMFDSE